MDNAIQEIQAAVYRARVKVRQAHLKKTAENPHFKSRYIPYEDIHQVVSDVLLEENLVYFQNATHDGTHSVITHFVQSPEGVIVQIGETKLPTPKMTPQDGGSGFSYAKRYGAAALFNLVETPDDDAEGAQQAHRARPIAQQDVQTRTGKPEPRWEADPPAAGTFELKGRTWILAQMNVKQLSTVVYTGDYPDAIRKQCNTELLKRVAAGNKEAINAVEQNAQP